MVVQPKVTYGFSAVSLRTISKCHFCGNEKASPQIQMDVKKGPQIVKTLLRKNKIGGFTPLAVSKLTTKPL